MNYPESPKILEEVNKAKNIVLFCHEGPDFDSILSCLMLRKVLIKLGKNVDIFSVDNLTNQNELLDPEHIIKKENPDNIDLNNYDIMFALDVSEIRRFGFRKPINFKGKIIRLDHHENIDRADITVNERDSGSTCSILFSMFKDWKISLDKKDFDDILLSMVSDSDTFRFSYPGSKIFKRVTELIDLGADYDKALYFFERSIKLDEMKFWSEAIKKIKIDKIGKFAYVALRYSLINKYEKYNVRTRQLSDRFLRNIDGTDFGIAFMEDKDGSTHISIRSRTPGFYVFNLIRQLGGGGHLTGGGIGIKDLPFDLAVRKVIKAARKYAKEYKYEN